MKTDKFICENGHIIEQEDLKEISFEEYDIGHRVTEPNYGCGCGAEVEEAYECDFCGKYGRDDDMTHGDKDICEECKAKLEKRLTDAAEELLKRFTPDELGALLDMDSWDNVWEEMIEEALN